MKTPERALLAFFQRVAQRDAAQLRSLETHPGFYLDSRRWRFTLPDLHHYLQRDQEGFRDIEYGRFRKLLYACPVNQTIEPLGAHVAIVDNQRKVDRSTYALEWHSPVR